MITITSLQITHQEQPLVDIAFTIHESLAMVGESGSGKSLTLKALLGLTPHSMQVKMKLEAPFTLANGQTVVLVPQNPFTSLSPMTKIKHHFFCSDDVRDEMLDAVGLDRAFAHRFSSELSGGQLQRVVLAIALSHQPKLLLLDEPTTALDHSSKEMIITLLKKLQSELGFKMLFVSHDMASVENLCDEIVVLHKGKVVEAGKMQEILNHPKEAYTQALIAANFKKRAFRS